MKPKCRFLIGVMLAWVVFLGLFSGCARWKKPMTELEIKQAYLDAGMIKGTTFEDLTVYYVAKFDHASVVRIVNGKIECWAAAGKTEIGGGYFFAYPAGNFELTVCYDGGLYSLQDATFVGILNKEEWDKVANAVIEQFPLVEVNKREDSKP